MPLAPGISSYLEGHEKSMMIHSRTSLAKRFFSGNSASYEHIANVCTLGLDHWWKRKILDRIPQHPTQIIDQACGTGLLTFKMAQRFPLCRMVGVDLQDEYLGIAEKKAEALQLTTVEFIHGKAEDVVLEGDSGLERLAGLGLTDIFEGCKTAFLARKKDNIWLNVWKLIEPWEKVQPMERMLFVKT
jgi:SAM-dependent methyltransferase